MAPRRQRCVMVLGTTSGCGKSFVVTLLCSWLRHRGERVAPYKAVNMSNNARLVPLPPEEDPNAVTAATTTCANRGGAAVPSAPLGEMGAAQYFQALAAGVAPDVRMNPVLLKPHSTGCDVVVNGTVRNELVKGLPWSRWNERLWPFARQALLELTSGDSRSDLPDRPRGYDRLVLEGMGSPCELNLDDIANLAAGREADAACLLVTDIDRGGAFAHLYGTYSLLPLDMQRRVLGFVINRFRGDPAVLRPGIEELQRRTSVPTIAVLPYLVEEAAAMPDEDALMVAAPSAANGSPNTGGGEEERTRKGVVVVVIIAYPLVSNIDEFEPLRRIPALHVVWARNVREVEQEAAWLILPGSKDTIHDLAWLKSSGIAEAVLRRARDGGNILGICGGLQMLGEAIVTLSLPTTSSSKRLLEAPSTDEDVRETTSPASIVPGLNLLPTLETRFHAADPTAASRKVLTRTSAMMRADAFAQQDPVLPSLSTNGQHPSPRRPSTTKSMLDSHPLVHGYEIHRGVTAASMSLSASDHRLPLRPFMETEHQEEAGDDGSPTVAAVTGWQCGTVYGTYLHGLFENDEFCSVLLGAVPKPFDHTRFASVVSRHFDLPRLEDILCATTPV